MKPLRRMGPDYRIRPAKHVERLLIVDALRRLRCVHPLRDYGYVGFGAQYFVDFTLFHRTLGISAMKSLEGGGKKLYERCVFNRPFDSVEVIEGKSWDHFSVMTFDRPTIVWVDYTAKLEARSLGDVDTLSLRLPPGSVLLVTVNADPDEVEEPPIGRLELLEKRVGADAVPVGTKDSDLDAWGNAAVIRQIVDEQIRASLATRADGTRYEQLFNFQYRDGARMLTVGGMLVDDGCQEKFQSCDWSSVEAYRPGPDAIRIELPSLTMRELAHLDKQLPNGVAAMASPGLAVEDVEAYAAYYRYYPRYALVDV